MTKIGSKEINGENTVNTSAIKDVDIKPSSVMPGNPANEIPHLGDTTYKSAIQGEPGADGADGVGIQSIALTSTNGLIDTYTITYTDATTKTFTVTNGADGKEIEFQKGTDSIEWRVVGDTTWNSLIPLADIKGDKGDTGNPPDLRTNVNALEYSKDGGTTWVFLYDLTQLQGSDGVSIDYVALTSGNHAPGTTDTYTIYYTDATTDTFTVYNGTNGTNGNDGIDGSDGDKWHHGINGASNDVGIAIQAYDEYYINTDTKVVFYKAAGLESWVNLFTMLGAVYKATITKTIDLTTLSIGDPLSITKAGLAYSVGQYITIANTSTNYILGRVNSYANDIFDITVMDIGGTGSYSSWTINLGAKPNVNESKKGAAYEMFLPAADGSVSARIAHVDAIFPEYWSLFDDAGDLRIAHNITDSDNVYRPAFTVEIMYLRTSDSKWVSLQGNAAYSSKENDLINGEVILNSLTTNVVDIKLHLMFY